jgi:uncharacterized protein (TIGR02284 family)
MRTTKENLEKRLQGILEKNIDARKGYENAAKIAESPNLKSFFKRKAQERHIFNQNLKKEIMASYGKIEEEGSTAGIVHRAWMDIKSFFTGNNDVAMLEECIRGDRTAEEEYEDILNNNDLPISIASIIGEQKMKIRTDLLKIKTLEDLKEVG